MPHVEIWHFPAELSGDASRRLEADIVDAVTRAFGVAEGVVSIGVESVGSDRWQERVYRPLITDRPGETPLLRTPNY
ncbi:hypothetical protein ACFWF7_03065 [Nocardia sp. NPDC060256]|uniref:hypothetical protein n=1 Tax=unclassified Nocardia TaxID=2637762 RepID=UPI00365F9CBB